MHIPRLHTPAALAVGDIIELETAVARRVLRVLRLRSGDALVLFNGDGNDYPARLHVDGRNHARAEVLEKQPNHSESPLHITLVQGISRGERMDYTLQKAVELGVSAVHPVLCDRSVVRLEGQRAEKRQRHWHGVITSACEQCGRSRLPELQPVAHLTEVLRHPPPGQRVLPQPGSHQGLSSLEDSSQLVLLIGPEGGLSEAEIEQARTALFQSIHLGPRVLRTETAGVATLAALQALRGDLR